VLDRERINLDADLVATAPTGREILVRSGESIGRAVPLSPA